MSAMTGSRGPSSKSDDIFTISCEIGGYIETVTYVDLSEFGQSVMKRHVGHFIIQEISIPTIRKMGCRLHTDFGRGLMRSYSSTMERDGPASKNGLERLALILANRHFASFSEGGVPNRFKNIEIIGVPLHVFERALAEEGFAVINFNLFPYFLFFQKFLTFLSFLFFHRKQV